MPSHTATLTVASQSSVSLDNLSVTITRPCFILVTDLVVLSDLFWHGWDALWSTGLKCPLPIRIRAVGREVIVMVTTIWRLYLKHWPLCYKSCPLNSCWISLFSIWMRIKDKSYCVFLLFYAFLWLLLSCKCVCTLSYWNQANENSRL